MKVTPKTLPGFMELLPKDQILFNEMKEKIQKNYEKYGFVPLDTPIIESSEILLAKAGGETEKQIYRFNKGENDLALRFDLTVPLAKYVAKNYNELTFPFKRYQIGKVYRGEKAQRGRFREFYQCDIDIIGDGELGIINDAELPSIIYTIFKDLGFEKFKIKINNRKILNGIFEELNLKEKSVDVMRVIDKITKIGNEAVKEELRKLGIEEKAIKKIMEFILIEGTTDEKLKELEKLEIKNELFNLGATELKEVIKNIKYFGVPEDNYKIDLSIARGLDYYTGTVYETFFDDYEELGSVCSGGRYENLAENYTDKKLPGVGISIGLTRLFDQLNNLKLISSEEKSISKVLVISMCEKDNGEILKVATELRKSNINTQIYFEDKKIKAKFKYADKLQIPYVIIIGEDEIKTDTVTLKNMKTGEQETLKLEDVIKKITF